MRVDGDFGVAWPWLPLPQGLHRISELGGDVEHSRFLKSCCFEELTFMVKP